MYKRVVFFVFIMSACAYIFLGAIYVSDRPDMHSVQQVQALFPTNKKAVDELVSVAIKKVGDAVTLICSIEKDKRTFDNTLGALDRVIEWQKIAQSSLYVLALVSPDESLRRAAQEGITLLNGCSIDMLTINQKLYDACHEYSTNHREKLSDEQRYFLDGTMSEFKRNGLQLAKKEQAFVRDLQKELSALALSYEAAYNAGSTEIVVTAQEIQGLDDAQIRSLKSAGEDSYYLSTSYDIFFKVMECCCVEQTRKRLYQAFMQRGYPENEKTLKQVIRVSDRLAKLLGYKSYAHYSLEDQMAKTPERVQEFLDDLYDRCYKKAMQEMKILKKYLPADVKLIDGKIKPWDLAYVYRIYKKRHIQLDEAVVATYFPQKYTLDALFKVYEDFFGVTFKKVSDIQLWHKDVYALGVYKNSQYIGMILLDLFPRPNKFSHAGQITVVPSVKQSDGKLLPAVVVVIANFSPEQKERPAVLTRHEVVTFFHECGHALHALLGSTELASLSGTSTKVDFVEMPSQMLEEWIGDPHILKKISSHIKTGKPLPQSLIKKIGQVKQCEWGDTIMRQIFLADVSLAYYMPGEDKDIASLWESCHKKLRPNLLYDTSNKGYCSFPHIMSYGPRYYGYLWSKVFAQDLFRTIQHYGLRSKAIGKRYIDEVISKGGSQDPEKKLCYYSSI